jgi:hypothetical protein
MIALFFSDEAPPVETAEELAGKVGADANLIKLLLRAGSNANQVRSFALQAGERGVAVNDYLKFALNTELHPAETLEALHTQPTYAEFCHQFSTDQEQVFMYNKMRSSSRY